MDTQETYLTTREAAEMLGLAPHTLRCWRHRGRGPQFIRLGDSQKARAVYAKAAIERWLAERSFSSTSHETEYRATLRECAAKGG